MASTYLTRTLGTPTNNKIWTFSAWVKRSRVNYGNYPNIFCANTLRDCIRFLNGDNIQVFFNEAGSGNLETSAKFRDVNAWYHIVVAVDTTQATASNRVKIYVNGEQITSFATETYPAQNYTNFINSAIQHRIGKDFSYTEYFDGLMSHIHFIDGTQYQASDFGETDSTTGEWKIKTNVSVTYGNNGFFILKDGNSVTDQSGNSNNWTVANGTLTKTEDCPSNVFATLNPLDIHHADTNTFANGNTSVTTNNAGARLTIAVESGKFYAEAKIPTNTSWIGVQDQSKNINSNDNSVLLYPAGASMYINGSNQGSGGYGSAWSANDIMMIAMDLTSTQKKVYFGKNGGWWNGSDYTANSPSTGENLSNDIVYAIKSASGSGSQTTHWNFGNGYFGTSAVSSAGTNASNLGIFEYDVPSGYTALCTKGLNE